MKIDPHAEVTSTDQDAWIDVARAVREQLVKRIPHMADMSPEGLKLFVDAINQARWMNEAAAAFDHTVECENCRPPYGN